MALSFFSKSIRYRFFFLDIQKMFIKSFEKTDKNSFLLVKGGVGDFLQYLPFMLKNKSLHYLVITHFTAANSFFNYLGIKVSETHFFSMPNEGSSINKLLEKRKNTYHCPRSIFFSKNPFELVDPIYNTKGKNLIVGIHVGASKIGVDKTLPEIFTEKLTHQLIADGFDVIFFCTKEERKLLPIKVDKRISFAMSKNIVKNLSRVKECDYFIGSDSAFKTMSSMLRIPTLVIMPIKKLNSFRDRMFLDPYVKEGIISVYTLGIINSYNINKALSFVRNKLNEVFKNQTFPD